MRMTSLVGLVAFSVIFLNKAVAQDSDVEGCYHGWVKFGTSCYGFGEEGVSWPGAASMCQIFDGSLAEIETPEENEFLKNRSRASGYRSLWVGATDIFSEGYFVWASSKTPLLGAFTDWAPGEPNHVYGDSSEDCMQLFSREGYAWNDANCDSNSPFVCEVKLEEE